MPSSTAIIFGAGSVGRGFLGQLFAESGYEVVFVDIDERLVDALNRQGGYTLRLAGIEDVRNLTIGSVRAVDGRDTEKTAAEVAKAELVATAVGGRALDVIAEPIAAGLARRWEAGEVGPLNVIVCENLPDAPELLRSRVRERLPDSARASLRRVGFVPAVVARMSPTPTPEQRAADPTLIVAEPYKVLPVDREAFVGEIPDVAGMKPVAPFDAYVKRKLYLHNGAHAVLGYLGHRRRHTYGYEALDDRWIRPLLDKAIEETKGALAAEYGFDPQVLEEYARGMLARFANRALADPIVRLCRDPLRKLGPDDRLVGAARLAEEHDVRPEGLAWGIASALTYDNQDDSQAVRLQRRLAEEGLARVLDEVCDIGEDESLAALVRGRYQVCRKGL